MAFLDKLNDLAKNIGDKTSEAIETTKLNNIIHSEKNAAAEDYKKIGEFYYNQFVTAGEGAVAVDVLELCQSARAHFDRIAETQAEIEKIKAESAAQKAAAVAPAAAPTATNPCPQCGTDNEVGVKFCRSCGAKLEAPVAEEPAPAAAATVCPVCGATIAPGVKFCPQCGQKME